MYPNCGGFESSLLDVCESMADVHRISPIPVQEQNRFSWVGRHNPFNLRLLHAVNDFDDMDAIFNTFHC